MRILLAHLEAIKIVDQLSGVAVVKGFIKRRIQPTKSGITRLTNIRAGRILPEKRLACGSPERWMPGHHRYFRWTWL